MKTLPMTRVYATGEAPVSPWESNVRYGAAFASTLVAVAAAQLIIPTPFALVLASVTILGLPLSFGLRTIINRPGSRLNRGTVNRIIMLLTLTLSFLFLRFSSPEVFRASLPRLLMAMDMSKMISLLMQVFLIFAVCRCLALVNDKDAALSTVPSFSVLLLLIVIHKGPEVVSYFLLWTMITAILFSLDHRWGLRNRTVGFIPAADPGQDAFLSARALLAVMGLSLFIAGMLSYLLVSRSPNERGRAETLIIAWASRLTNLTNFSGDVSINSGPERQIDFSTGPALPTRLPLWKVQAYGLDDKPYYPTYWRMFTLVKYDGHSWSQSPGAGDTVPVGPFSWRSWPIFKKSRSSPHILLATRAQLAALGSHQKGFDIGANLKRGETAMADFGAPRVYVRSYVQPLEPNSGFLPVLPSLRALMLPRGVDLVRLRDDQAVDVGVVEPNQPGIKVLSELPPIREYGFPVDGVPLLRTDRPNKAARLNAEQRRVYLQLPPGITPRVRHFASNALKKIGADESDYRRAERLAIAIQNVAQYTLRPPDTPITRDAVDYFLFESERGYCTYFASALTVLCRTQNIPARIVSGFTNTEWHNEGPASFGILREANAHAWTEVWVDGWGWATVDATPSDDRGSNAPSAWDNLQQSFKDSFASAEIWAQRHFWTAVTGITLIASALIIFFSRGGFLALWDWLVILSNARTRAKQGYAAHDERAVILSIYDAAARQLTRRYRRRATWETPLEWFGAAAMELPPGNAASLRIVAQSYTEATYSVSKVEAGRADAARTALAGVVWEEEQARAWWRVGR